MDIPDCGIEHSIREIAHHAAINLQVPLLRLLFGYSGRFVRSIVRGVPDLVLHSR